MCYIAASHQGATEIQALTPLSPSCPSGDQLSASTKHTVLALLSHFVHSPTFTPGPDMEPIKVQSEGGLNVTLTIRLLMHGKVEKDLESNSLS